MGKVFGRTAIFMKENRDNGDKIIRRVPWDLINLYGKGGFFISPMPLPALSDVSPGEASTTTNEISDMLSDESLIDGIDDVENIMWVESEQAFLAKFEGTFGFYNSESTVSAEFGYPVDSGL